MKSTQMIKQTSVVYSFNGRWEDGLVSGAIKVFFRKRRPVKMPSKVFFYIGTPVKKVIGFAEVTRIEPVDLEMANKIKRSGAITENELISYIGSEGSVNAVWIAKPVIFPKPFTLTDLNERYNFHPPQSFSNVTGEFEKYLLGTA